MTSFEVSTHIRRPVEVIVAAILNADNAPYWTTHLERLETVSGTPGTPGCVGHLHYLENGRRYVLEDRLVEAEPGRRYLSEVSGPPIAARVETLLAPSGDGTDMILRWSGHGRIFPLNLLLPLMRRRMVRSAKTELETFRDLVEKRGIDFSRRAPDERQGAS